MARQIHRLVDIIGLDARWRVKPARELLPTRQGLLLHVVIVVLAKVIGRQRRGTLVRFGGPGLLLRSVPFLGVVRRFIGALFMMYMTLWFAFATLRRCTART